ncbi:MAG: acylneuraminate cytidylyltransferase [Wenzhouxiangella sp.]|nr:MAG: acylneuraminate cytidylyltransferase [Wenzhouxiangella sp.]
MLAEQRILVVVPARGGSKGIPMKNLLPVAGKPLLVHTADLVAELDWVDRAVVSTDHLVIRETALAHGLDAPFMRPTDLSGDRIGDVDVLRHALQATEADDGLRYDIIVMLQPTSPLRRAEHVRATVERLINDQLDAVWTVSPTDLKAHPFKQLVVDSEGRMGYFDQRGAEIIARQQLEPVYHRNGVAYALRRDTLLDQASLMGARAGAVVIEEAQVSIDTLADVDRVERALAELNDYSDAPAAARAAAVPDRPRRLVIDIDGVLAEPVPDLDYAQAGPISENVERVNALFEAGCHIVLFTARGSGTGKDWQAVTAAQMERWGVRYHELRFGKPPADYYVDDRLVSLPQALALCGLIDPGNQH